MPPNTVKVDRTTKWGNPFTPKAGENKDYCATLFQHMVAGYICISRKEPTAEAQLAYLRMAKKNIGKLRGKNLACWCRLDAPCHADVLLRAANKKRKG
jgi:hypothetical protein